MTSIIRLLDSNGIQIIDSISGEYEDSFSLESFDELRKAHFAVEPSNTRGFIIARVQTADPKQPEKEFYSYYNAFHLNKILFQTQIVLKKRYIHRLHVLNPLTNTDIIGNVEYYLVKPAPIMVKQPDYIASKITIDTSNPNSDERSDAISPSVAAIEGGERPRWTVGNHQITNEDDNDKKDSSQYPMTLESSNPTIEIPVDRFFPLNPKKSHSLTITAQLPRATLFLNEIDHVNLSPGSITQFTIPISAERLTLIIPKTHIGNRRVLSYRNAVSASLAPVSFLEWARLIEREKQLLMEKVTADLETYEMMETMLLSPGEIRNSPTVSLEHYATYEKGTEHQSVFDAILFATDDDFLSSSKIRKLFLVNAVLNDDATLFEMREYTGEEEQRTLRTDNLALCSIQ